MTDPVLGQYREEILRLAAELGARNVRVFGSRARGEAHEDSDIDLIVDPDESCSLLDLIAIEQGVEDLTQLEVDVVTPRSISPYLRDKVLAEAIPL